MNAIFIILQFLFLIHLLNAQNVPGDEIKKLVYSTSPDSPDEVRNEWIAKIKQMPNANHKIIELFNNEKDWELLRYPYAALHVRKNLSDSEIGELLNNAIAIASRNDAPTKHEKVYASYIFALLADYPSPKNEEILISHFYAHDGEYKDFIVQALKSIGTKASIPILKDYIASRTTPQGMNEAARLALNAVENIERRELRKNRGDARKTPNSDITTPNQQVTNDVSLKDETESTPTQSKFIVLAIALVLIFVGYKFLAKSRKRK